MSVAVSTWVWKLDLPATEKLIMLALADYANDEDYTCWPSLTHLSKKTGLDRSTVWKVIERVIAIGLVSRHGSHGQNTKYVVHIGVFPKQLVDVGNQLPKSTSCPEHTEVVAHGNKVVAHGNPNTSLTITKPSDIPPLPPKGGKPRRSAIALQTYLANCKQEKTKPIPESDPVFSYAEKAGIPGDLLHLCWQEFVDRHKDSGKRYSDWRQAFRNCVRGNWYRLWYADPGGGIVISSQGRLAQNKHEAA